MILSNYLPAFEGRSFTGRKHFELIFKVRLFQLNKINAKFAEIHLLKRKKSIYLCPRYAFKKCNLRNGALNF